MNENVGTVDRALRVVIGISLVLAGWLGSGGALGIILFVIGLVLLATGLLSRCPIYSVANLNTVEEDDPRGH